MKEWNFKRIESADALEKAAFIKQKDKLIVRFDREVFGITAD